MTALAAATLAAASAPAVIALAQGADPPATAAFETTDATTFALVGGSGSGSDARIATGGKATFTNKPGGSIEEHDVTFFRADVSCVQTVGGPTSDPRQFPIPASAGDWSGECTFSRAGAYPYVCNLHEDVGMSGTITVTDPTAPPPPPPPPAIVPPPAPAPPGAGTPPPPAATGRPLSITVSARQRGFRVRGRIADARRSSRVAIAVTAKRSDLGAPAGRAAPIAVGRLGARTTTTGRLAFTVRLNAKARAAIVKRGRLAVAVRVTAAPRTGTARPKTFRVTLRLATRRQPAS